MKKGQMKLSFGMIFSIILIIFFIAFAIYGIFKFLELQDSIQINLFVENLQRDVDKMWRSPKGSQEVSYRLPSKITSICFVDDEHKNLNFRSDKFIPGNNIKNIDIKENFCIENINNKVSMVLKKDYGEPLVLINEK